MLRNAKDLGIVTAYAYAVKGGFKGTEDDFCEMLYDAADGFQKTEESATAAFESGGRALTSETAAEESKNEAANSVAAANEAKDAAESSESAASKSQTAAESSKNAAATSATEASKSEANAKTSENNSANSALESKSYAIGGTGSRTIQVSLSGSTVTVKCPCARYYRVWNETLVRTWSFNTSCDVYLTYFC